MGSKLLLSPEQINMERVENMARVFLRVNRALAGQHIKVQVVFHPWNSAPSWTDGVTITFNAAHIGSVDSIEDIIKLTGLNYHELGHVFYTPRANSALSKHAQQNGNFKAFNILEDQRLETLMVGTWTPIEPYFVTMFMKFIGDDKEGWPRALPLTHGRRYLPDRVRKQFGDIFERQDLRPNVERIIDEYRQLIFPADNDRAAVLVDDFGAILREMSAMPKDPNGHVAGQRPDVPTAGRPLAPKDQEVDRERAQDREEEREEERAEEQADEDEPDDAEDIEDGLTDADADDEEEDDDAGPGVPEADTAEEDGDDEPEAPDADDTDEADSDGGSGDDQDDAASSDDVEPGDEDVDGSGSGDSDDDLDDEPDDGSADDEGDDAEGVDGSDSDDELSNEDSDADEPSATKSDDEEGIDVPGEQQQDEPEPEPEDEGADEEPPPPPAIDEDTLRKLFEDVIREAETRPDVLADAKQKQQTIVNGDGDLYKRLPEADHHDKMVPPATKLAASKFAQELQRLVVDSDPGWNKYQSTGKLNVQRLLEGGDLDTVFDQWHEGNDLATDTETIILLDMSTSMARVMDEACQAVWAIKKAAEAGHGNVTVLGYSGPKYLGGRHGPNRDGIDPTSEWYIYGRADKAQPGKYRSVNVWSGTQPHGALEEAARIFYASKHENQLLYMVSDGEWQDTYEAEEWITRMNAAGVLTVMVWLNSITDGFLESLTDKDTREMWTDIRDQQEEQATDHQCKVFEKVRTVGGLVQVARKVVKQQMSRKK